MTSSRFRRATIAVSVVAVLLRIALATVNRDSSDNHVTVIEYMAFANEIPEYDRDRDWVKEAFQPKLYHAVVAGIVKIYPFDTNARPCTSEYPGTSPHVILVGQLVSAVAGILTMWVIWRFLTVVGLSDRARFFTFSLAALNPALISINVQVTNDSFVILFGSISLYYGYRFFRDFHFKDFLWMTAAAIATAMSKATGFPVLLAIVVVFAIAAVRRPEKTSRRTPLGYSVVFVAAVLSSLTVVAPKIGSYWELYRRYGSPFVTNRTPQPFPPFFQQTGSERDAEVRSIWEPLFTFRIIGLLEDPKLPSPDDGSAIMPLHRTSLWSQLYGRMNFTRFEALPTWQTDSALVMNIARLTFIVALFPAALLLVGSYETMKDTVFGVTEVRPHEWLIVISSAGYTAFIVMLALRYRDVTFFKPIHVFAGLLAFLVIFGRACDRLYSTVDGYLARRTADALLTTLIVLYATDCTLLAVQLLESCRS